MADPTASPYTSVAGYPDQVFNPPPFTITYTQQSSTAILATWTAWPGALYYEAYLGRSPDDIVQQITDLTATSFVFDNLIPRIPYYVQIVAVLGPSHSVGSIVQQIMTTQVTSCVLTGVTGLVLTGTTGGTLTGTCSQSGDGGVTVQFSEATTPIGCNYVYVSSPSPNETSSTIVLSGTPTETVTVNYQFIDGPLSESCGTTIGVNGTDYVGTNGTLTWLAGDSTPQTITFQTITPTGATFPTFTIQLSNPTGATLGANASQYITFISV